VEITPDRRFPHLEPNMTASEYLLNVALLGFVLYSNLGTHAFDRRRSVVRPIVLAVLIGSTFLTTVPSAGNDRVLEAVGLFTGVVLGVASALLVRVHRTKAGVVTTAGVSFAALWVAAIGGRVLFSYGADHWFGQGISNFSRTHSITSADAWTAAFVLMALAMVITRVLVTAAQATMVQTRTAAVAA
jgi:hypothetical protein